jgi:hypothetical protein
MKKSIVFFLFCFCAISISAQQISLYDLRCENKKEPLGIDNEKPQLSWKIQSNQRNIIQKAYCIIVADNKNLIEKNIGNIWSSPKINSSASIYITYAGKALQAAKKYYWKVKVWDNQQHESFWSKTASWQTGLFTKEDWKNAKWIALQQLHDTAIIIPSIAGTKKKTPTGEILPLFRKEFKTTKPIAKATVFIAGLGHFELHINGEKIGDHYLDAGWTNYLKEAQYETFDVTNALIGGSNAIGVILGNGFYFIPAERYRKLKTAYGFPKIICRLLVEYTDGSFENIVSDESWKADAGPVIFSSVYGGEDYDANLEQNGWDQPNFSSSHWKNVLIVDGTVRLYSQLQEPIKIFDHFNPIFQKEIKQNEWIYDFGQNASAIVSLKVQGNKGDTIRLIPAELMNADGTANQKATGSPYCFNYILKGNGIEKWQPKFTYYGSRYIQAELRPLKEKSTTKIISVEMLHVRNAAYDAGNFACSNTLFNRIDTLIKWAVKSNMVSVFTDCPHREKLGWLEETHLVGASVKNSFDILNLCRKAINDMKSAQTDEGLIPEIAPEFIMFNEPFRDSPEWGSACILVPWYVYQWYGDKQLLTDSYDMMKKYLNYLKTKSDSNILSYGLSDWFDIGPKKSGFAQMTPMGLTATATYYYDVTIMAQIAALLNKTEDANNYKIWAVQIKQTFNDKFFDKEKKQYGTGSQTSNAMPLYMGLVEPENKTTVINNLVKALESNDYRLTAGDIGFRYLIQALYQAGRSDVIYKMNNRDDVPGYGYQLKHGATALTESWQAYPSVSNNHFMLGDLMEWLYSALAGIDQTENSIAFNEVKIKPEIVGDITAGKGTYESPYGTIATSWKKTNRSFEIDVTVPANSKAVVYLPVFDFNKDVIEEAGKVWNGTMDYKDGKAIIKTGSGKYHFSVVYK